MTTATLNITPGGMTIAGKFNSENDHLRKSAGVNRVALTEGVTSGRRNHASNATAIWVLDGVLAYWDMQFSSTGTAHDLDAETYEVGV